MILVQNAKSVAKSTLVPFFCLLYVSGIVLFIPISRIVTSDADVSFSSEITRILGGFDYKTEDEILSMIFDSEDARVRPLVSTSSIAGVVFGAVHCFAWHFSFPSRAEQILWRAASLGIVRSCTVILQTVLCAREDAEGFGRIVTRLLASIGALFCISASFIYPLARITLLVIAISSLRSLSPSALDTIDWVGFVPHI